MILNLENRSSGSFAACNHTHLTFAWIFSLISNAERQIDLFWSQQIDWQIADFSHSSVQSGYCLSSVFYQK